MNRVFLSLVLALVVATSVQPAMSAELFGIQILSHGSYTARPVETEGKAAQVEAVNSVFLLDYGTAIRMQKDLTFGLEGILQGSPRGERVNMTVRMSMPGGSSEQWTIWPITGQDFFCGWTLDENDMDKPGHWKLSLFAHGKPQAEMVFLLEKKLWPQLPKAQPIEHRTIAAKPVVVLSGKSETKQNVKHHSKQPTVQETSRTASTKTAGPADGTTTSTVKPPQRTMASSTPSSGTRKNQPPRSTENSPSPTKELNLRIAIPSLFRKNNPQTPEPVAVSSTPTSHSGFVSEPKLQTGTAQHGPTSTDQRRPFYLVQVGTYSRKVHAAGVMDRLAAEGLQTCLYKFPVEEDTAEEKHASPSNAWFILGAGEFATMKEARTGHALCETTGEDCIISRKQAHFRDLLLYCSEPLDLSGSE